MRGSVAKSGANLRRRTIRRRVIALGVAGVTIAGAQIGVSMLGDTGTVDAAVTQQTNVTQHIYATSLPTGVAGTGFGWAHNAANNATGVSTATPLNSATPVRVSWAAAPSTTGNVTGAGDVAIIDATVGHLPAGAKGLAVTVYISNLAGFAKNYTSFALPVGVYQWNSATGVWTQFTVNAGAYTDFYASSVTPPTAIPFPAKNSLYISDSDGSVTLNLPAGPSSGTATGYYEIVIDKANGFWQSAGTITTTDLGPSFYLTSTDY